MLVDEGLLRREGGGWVADRGSRRARRAAHDPRAPARAARSARARGTSADPARFSRRPGLLVGRRRRAVARERPRPRSAHASRHSSAHGADSRTSARTFAAEDAFRFRHILTRDAAYAALAKEARAETCTSVSARWLERRAACPGCRVRRDSSATTSSRPCGTRRELGGRDDEAALGPRRSRPANRLAAGRRRAAARADAPAAASLLGRAALRLLPLDARGAALSCSSSSPTRCTRWRAACSRTREKSSRRPALAAARQSADERASRHTRGARAREPAARSFDAESHAGGRARQAGRRACRRRFRAGSATTARSHGLSCTWPMLTGCAAASPRSQPLLERAREHALLARCGAYELAQIRLRARRGRPPLGPMRA